MIKKEDVIRLLDKRINDNKQHLSKDIFNRNVCWLCYGEHYCTHRIAMEEIEEIKKQVLELKDI